MVVNYVELTQINHYISEPDLTIFNQFSWGMDLPQIVLLQIQQRYNQGFSQDRTPKFCEVLPGVWVPSLEKQPHPQFGVSSHANNLRKSMFLS